VTRGWLVVTLVGVATMAIKASSPVALGGRSVPPVLRPALARLAPALFGALVATQVFARGEALTLDARVGGLAAALIGAALKAPPIAVLAGAAAVTASLRHRAAASTHSAPAAGAPNAQPRP
jgi:branched-subunit amino acid transport protein